MPNARDEATEFEIELANVRDLLGLGDAEVAVLVRDAKKLAQESPTTPRAALRKTIRDRLKD